MSLPKPAPRSSQHIPSFHVCGVRIDDLGPSQAVEVLSERAKGTSGHSVHLCNAYTLALASRNDEFRSLLNEASINVADGASVAWVGRRVGMRTMTSPVRGMTWMMELMADGVAWGARHYLYGGTPETLAALERELPNLVPGVQIVGAESPPFRTLRSEEEGALLDRLDEATPNYVWVGLGTPKQDAFVEQWTHRVSAVLVPVGAAFDFAAGTKREAPKWLHGTGCEWIYRLMSEPRRLWRRYLFGNAIFVVGMLRHGVSSTR